MCVCPLSRHPVHPLPHPPPPPRVFTPLGQTRVFLREQLVGAGPRGQVLGLLGNLARGGGGGGDGETWRERVFRLAAAEGVWLLSAMAAAAERAWRLPQKWLEPCGRRGVAGGGGGWRGSRAGPPGGCGSCERWLQHACTTLHPAAHAGGSPPHAWAAGRAWRLLEKEHASSACVGSTTLAGLPVSPPHAWAAGPWPMAAHAGQGRQNALLQQRIARADVTCVST